MSNVQDIRPKNTIEVELGGKTHTMTFDLNTFALLEEVYGDVNKALAALDEGSPKALRAVIWAGLKASMPADFTIEQAGAMVSPGDLGNLGKQMGKAVSASLPAAEEAIDGPEGAGLKNPPTAPVSETPGTGDGSSTSEK